MKRLDWTALAPEDRARALDRPGGGEQDDLESAVRRIFNQVRADGDGALRALTRRFDNVEIAGFAVSDQEFAEAEAGLDPALRAAMVEAIGRLKTWHIAGTGQGFEVETAPGVACGRLLRPIARVGLYVPAGSAPLPST
ncbi:MAG TPA: histidinol dehydrogenase, partial [Arenimonas sp.]